MAKEIKAQVAESEEVVAAQIELTDEEKEAQRLELCKLVGAAMLSD